MPFPRRYRFTAQPDPERRGHWRVYDSVTRQFLGRSYSVQRHAFADAQRRNTLPAKHIDHTGRLSMITPTAVERIRMVRRALVDGGYLTVRVTSSPEDHDARATIVDRCDAWIEDVAALLGDHLAGQATVHRHQDFVSVQWLPNEKKQLHMDGAE